MSAEGNRTHSIPSAALGNAERSPRSAVASGCLVQRGATADVGAAKVRAARSTSRPRQFNEVQQEEEVMPLDVRVSLDEAIAQVRAAGYRVSKPKAKSKGRVGPTFVAEFADGVVTRMSTFTSLEKLDWDRGERLSIAAWQSRRRARERKQQRPYRALSVVPVPPAIVSAHFEQDGVVLARRPDSGAVA